MTVWIVAGFSRADLFRQAGAVLRNRIRHSGTIFSSDGCTADGWSYGLRRNLRETGEYWAAAHFCSTRSWQQIATVLGGAAYDSGFWASISNTLCFFWRGPHLIRSRRVYSLKARRDRPSICSATERRAALS
jgi:hypothetical protein